MTGACVEGEYEDGRKRIEIVASLNAQRQPPQGHFTIPRTAVRCELTGRVIG
jgi:hypothetical protein